jgi:hypothetical protein
MSTAPNATDLEANSPQESESSGAPVRQAGRGAVRFSLWSGLGLAVTALVQIVFAILEGSYQTGGSFLEKVGSASFTSLGADTGLLLIVGVVLASLPLALGQPITESERGGRTFTVTLAIVLGVLLVILAGIGAQGEIYVITSHGSLVSEVYRFQILAYLVSTVGSGAVAAALGFMAARMPTAIIEVEEDDAPETEDDDFEDD